MKVFVLGQRRPLTGRDENQTCSPFPLSESSKPTDRVDREGAQPLRSTMPEIAQDISAVCKDQMQKAWSHVATFPVFSEVRQQRSWNNASPVI